MAEVVIQHDANRGTVGSPGHLVGHIRHRQLDRGFFSILIRTVGILNQVRILPGIDAVWVLERFETVCVVRLHV